MEIRFVICMIEIYFFFVSDSTIIRENKFMLNVALFLDVFYTMKIVMSYYINFYSKRNPVFMILLKNQENEKISDAIMFT